VCVTFFSHLRTHHSGLTRIPDSVFFAGIPRFNAVRAALADLFITERIAGVTLWEMPASARGSFNGVVFKVGRGALNLIDTSDRSIVRRLRLSEFCLCPLGQSEVAERLFNAVQAGCIPVLIADHMQLPFPVGLSLSLSIPLSFNQTHTCV
jgi:hypothetical protein